MSKAACVLVLLYAACALGTSQRTDDANGGPSDGPKQYHDAEHVTGDGPITPHDAPIVPHDAFVPQDAPNQSGGFCTDNTNCISTECCWVAICVPGTQVGTNLCFPS
jgi:hypothetical protein